MSFLKKSATKTIRVLVVLFNFFVGLIEKIYFCRKFNSMTATVALEKKKIKEEKTYTFLEYLKKEEKSIEKHEFYNGQIVKMSGAKYRHNKVAGNTITALNNAIDTLPVRFEVLTGDQKIYVERENICIYPDALVVCEGPVFWNRREDILLTRYWWLRFYRAAQLRTTEQQNLCCTKLYLHSKNMLSLIRTKFRLKLGLSKMKQLG